MRRAEHYIAAHPGRKLTNHAPRDVEVYLRDVGHHGEFKDGQYRQIADAIPKFFEPVGVGWLAVVDRNHRRNSARGMERTHPTVGRDGDEPEAPPNSHPAPLEALR